MKTATPAPIPVGTILCANWGYTMTLVSFYKVIRTSGKSTVELVQLRTEAVTRTGEKMIRHSGTYFSIPTEALLHPGTVLKKQVRPDREGLPSVKITEFQRAYIWDGSPQYEDHND